MWKELPPRCRSALPASNANTVAGGWHILNHCCGQPTMLPAQTRCVYPTASGNDEAYQITGTSPEDVMSESQVSSATLDDVRANWSAIAAISRSCISLMADFRRATGRF